MATAVDLAHRSEHLTRRLVDLGNRLDPDDRAELAAIVAEQGDLLAHAIRLLDGDQ